MLWDDKERALECLKVLSEQYWEHSRRAVEEEKRDEYRDISEMLSDALELLTEDRETSIVFNGKDFECEKCKKVAFDDILFARNFSYCPNCGRRIVWNV